tara:strand:+ start:110 stop:1315 length:1206 start_codon:yes stop_codon:yes gene_type:complete
MVNNVVEGHIAENILNFSRILRSAGLSVGPPEVLDAIRALSLVGFSSREDLYWLLFSNFVKRSDQRQIFDQAFHIFWKNPQIMERMMSMMLPVVPVEDNDTKQISRRLSDAMRPGVQPLDQENERDSEVEFDASFTFSGDEVLQEKDFEQMSQEEIAQAKKAIQELKLPMPNVRTRRYRSSGRGHKIDMRKTLKGVLREPETMPLAFKVNKLRHPPIVILCDISGSMDQYSRMFLHFMHAVTNDRERTHCFTFGTRLTNISRHLRRKDVDLALDSASQSVKDWSGGTRIGYCLKQFNNRWSRRVLAQGAVCILVTDGLDRDQSDGLEKEMDRLNKSVKRLIWLNPLLRYEGFEPKAQGIRKMLPYVDEFKTAHNIKSLVELSDIISSDDQESRYRLRFANG